MTKSPVPAAILLATAVVIGAAAVHDFLVPMRQQYVTRAAISSIENYRAWISPLLRSKVSCRFEPSCSEYGLKSVQKYGGIRGSWRALKRIARCNPWTKQGTDDPP